jgi:hypothetical protein
METTFAPWEKPEETLAPWEMPKAQTSSFGPVAESIDPDTLTSNKDWMEASRIMYRYDNGEDFTGTDQELAEYSLDALGYFNYNLVQMGVDAAQVTTAPTDYQKSFLYLMDSYDALEMSWGGTGRFLKGVASDPTTYAGLLSFGVGTAASAGGKITTKEGLKTLLGQAVRTSVIAGVEGTAYGAATSVARQQVEVAGGRREEIDSGQVIRDAAIGGALGATLGGTVEVAGAGVKTLFGKGAKQAATEVQPNPATLAPETATTTSVADPMAAMEVPDAVPTASVDVPSSVVPGATVPTPDVPGATQVEDVLAALKSAAPDMEAGAVPRTRADLFKQVEEVSTSLEGLGIRSAQDAVDLFTKSPLSPDQATAIKTASQQAAQNVATARAELLKVKNAPTSSADEVAQATDQLKKIEGLQDTLAEMDAKLSSKSGTDLGTRVGGIMVNENRGLSVEKLLRDKKIDPVTATPEEKLDAELEFVSRIEQRTTELLRDREMVELTKKIDAAANAGDIATTTKLMKERDALLSDKIKKDTRTTKAGRAYEWLNNNVVTKINEYVISTVFDIGTLSVNLVPALVKTAYQPAYKMVLRGAGKAARAEAAHTYAAMGANMRFALKAARAAFKYEQGLLDGNMSKFLEGGPAIKGLKGRILRFFPRALTATDEFFARINYNGYVAGDAAHNAAEQGIRKGLKGEALDTFVKEAVDKAVKQAYEIAPDKAKVIDTLRMRGMERGLKGDKLDFWIKAELDKNEDLFRKAVDEAGVDFTDDLLFKREFSGDNAPSKLAKGYERFVNKNPLMRLAGQLFFRTPVRVFQEGIRLTPGIQIIDPTFLPDLTGKNGVPKQLRAQGEALLSYGIAAWVMGMYASGNITGAGPSDYRQRRALEDGKDWEPYTIRFGDGSTWSYRNMDPFATPIKIMVNMMDRISELEYRKSQGEKVDNQLLETIQYGKAGMLSVVQAIRDASLTTGFDQLLDAWDTVTQESDTTALRELEKLVGKKVQLAVPAVVSGGQTVLEGLTGQSSVMRDPATIEQYFMARLNPGNNFIPTMYDALGRPRTINNQYSGFFGPLPTTESMREKGMSEKEQVVLNGLADLQISADTSFVFPYKMPGFDFDMRKRMTTDGRETVYDRVVRRYRELDPTGALYPLFEGEGAGTVGTAATDGSRLIATRQIINKLRSAAFAQVMGEELNLQEEFIQNRLKEADAEAGRWDTPSNPYR